MPALEFSAALLAGGRSTRMGREKATLEIDGVPLWRRQRDVLAGVGPAEILLSVRSGQDWVRHVDGFSAVVVDAFEHAGPLCGITAALERMSCRHVAVLAVDMPQMKADWFRSLLAECEPGRGAVGRRDEKFEPLAAIYPRELMPLAWEALLGGRHALQPLISEAESRGLMRVHEIAPEEAAWFENWNEPART
jgi:molybdopterin-guanine dinucleotide biosynthesis protein A